jgi:C4-dicarboxylate transporter DctM subunit
MEASLLLVTIAWMARRYGYGTTTTRADWGGFVRRLPRAGPAVLMPVLIIGSIYTGYLTPTEVSAFAAIYAAVLCLAIYRSVSLGDTWEVVRDSVLQTTMIFAVVMGGSLVGFVLARMGLSARVVAWITSIEMNAWQFLLVANAILLVLGMFLDGVAMIVLTSPLLFPVATALGINPIHFAVVMVANVEIATLTPPIGLNLFVMAGISKLPIHEVVRGVMPFYGVRFTGLMLITYIPAISLALV